MILYQRDHTFIVCALDIVVIGFINQNDRRRRKLCEKSCQRIPGRYARSWIVWITDINEACPVCGSEHFLQVVMIVRREVDLYNVSVRYAGMATYCLECRIGHYNLLISTSESGGAKFQNLSRAVAQE